MEPTQSIFRHVLLRAAWPERCGTALLTWTADDGPYVAQVYVNGRLADVVEPVSRGERWLHLDRAADNVVELLAVDPAAAFVEMPERLETWRPRLRLVAELAVLRDEALPPTAEVVVAVDGEVHTRGRMWSQRDARRGFGGLFGHGSFGDDGGTTPGFGVGECGVGAFGWDGAAWRWRGADLAAGTHSIDVSVMDETGSATGEAAAVMAVIDALPRPARNVVLDSAAGVLRWAAE